MSESEPTLYGTPDNKINKPRTISLPFPRQTDAELATRWARRAANEDRLDLASALYRIAAQAARIEQRNMAGEVARAKVAVCTRCSGVICWNDQTCNWRHADRSLDGHVCLPMPDSEAKLRKIRAEYESQLQEGPEPPIPYALADGQTCVVQPEKTPLEPILEPSHAYEQRSHAPAVCEVCGGIIRWLPHSGWGHTDPVRNVDHSPLPKP